MQPAADLLCRNIPTLTMEIFKQLYHSNGLSSNNEPILSTDQPSPSAPQHKGCTARHFSQRQNITSPVVLHYTKVLALMLMVWLHCCSWLSHNDHDVLAQATKSGTTWPSQQEGEEGDFTPQAAVIPLKFSSTGKNLHLLKLVT